MTFDSAYPTLKLFIEKASKLENSSFVKKILQEFRLDLTIERGKPMEVTSIHPNEENIDAFILTFRFFIQNNEEISIANFRDIFDSRLVSRNQKDKFNKIRGELNKFLSEESNITIYEENILNRTLMETFIYGGLSHATKEKKEKFDLWMSREDAREFLWHKFSMIIFTVLQAIQNIRDLVEEIISGHQLMYK